MKEFGYTVDYMSYGIVGKMVAGLTEMELYEDPRCDRFLWKELFETSFLENCGARKGDVFSVHRKLEAQNGFGTGEVRLTSLEYEGKKITIDDINYEAGLRFMEGLSINGLKNK